MFKVVCLIWLSCLSIITYAETNVMLIHSYHKGLDWVDEMNIGIKQELGDDYRLSIQYMDTKRLPVEKFQAVAERTFDQFQREKPDVVIICDDNGFRLLGQRIAATTPVVFCGINGEIRRDYPWVIEARNVTGVLERPLIKRTIAEVMRVTRITPRNALILLGDSPTARAFHYSDLGGKDMMRISRSINADVLRVADLDEWKQKVQTAKKQGYDLLLVAGFGAMHDKNGKHISLDELSEWVALHSPLLNITVHGQGIGPGKIMGGMVVSGVIMGQDVAKQLKKVMERPAMIDEIPFVFQNQGKLIFSRDGLRHWGLTLDKSRSKQLILLP